MKCNNKDCPNFHPLQAHEYDSYVCVFFNKSREAVIIKKENDSLEDELEVRTDDSILEDDYSEKSLV